MIGPGGFMAGPRRRPSEAADYYEDFIEPRETAAAEGEWEALVEQRRERNAGLPPGERCCVECEQRVGKDHRQYCSQRRPSHKGGPVHRKVTEGDT